MVIEIRWQRKRLRIPSCRFNTSPQLPKEGEGINAQDTRGLHCQRNEVVASIVAGVLHSSAWQAAAPALLVALATCDGTNNVSGQVASQTSTLPILQSTGITPSGCFPSAQKRFEGSSLERILVVVKDW